MAKKKQKAKLPPDGHIDCALTLPVEVIKRCNQLAQMAGTNASVVINVLLAAIKRHAHQTGVTRDE